VPARPNRTRRTILPEAFEQGETARRIGGLPTEPEAAVPIFRKLLKRYHAAILQADHEEAKRISEDADQLAVTLNGGDHGIKANEDSPCYLLERATQAKLGAIPMYGQTGEFTIKIDGIPVLIKADGIYGIGEHGFDANRVDETLVCRQNRVEL